MAVRFYFLFLATCLMIPLAHAGEPLVFAHIFPETTLQHAAMVVAAEELAVRSNGRLTVKIVPGGQLGDQDSRIMEAISVGKADMGYLGGAFAARDYAPIGILSAAYNFRDFDHWQHFRDGPMARELLDPYEKASGLAIVGVCYNGPRHIAAKSAIGTPEDLVNLRIRVPNAPVYLHLFRAFGAIPVSIPFGKTYDSLKSGAVDAEESPLTTIDALKFYEVAPHIALTGHAIETNLIVISKKRLDGLPPEDRQLVRTIFGDAARRLSERVHQEETELPAKLTRLGVTVTTVDRSQFLAKVSPLLHGDSFAWSGDIYERVQAIK